MGTNVLGDSIKAALDALSEADKLDRTKTMRAMGNEIEDWHEENPAAGGFHDKDFLGGVPAADDEFHIYDLSFGGYKKLTYSNFGFAAVVHNHDSDYLGISAQAVDSDKLDGSHASAFSLTGHNHDSLYLGISAKAADSDLLDNHDTAYFAIAGHLHTGVYLPIAGKAADSDKLDGIHGASLLRSDADDNVSAHTEWQDSKEVRLGTDADFRMLFNGSNTYFKGYKHGAILYIQGENAAGTNKAMLYMDPDGYVKLYYAGNLKLETISTGVAITGTLTVSSTTKVTNLNADLLEGYHAQVAVGGNTIVLRHASGYIYANYFNTTPNDVASGVTKVCVESGNDGFIRHGTIAAIRAFIGAGAGNGLDADKVDGLHASEIGGGGGIKIGAALRSAAGAQVITGVGFQPSVVIFIAGDYLFGNVNASWGFDDGTVHHNLRLTNDGTSQVVQNLYSLNITRDGSNYLRGYITALGSDGFTITWVEVGSVECTFFYLCLP